MSTWKAPDEVAALLSKVQSTNHSPRLENARIAITFDESKVFVKNKLNLGKVTKFSPIARLYQREKFDFCLTISSDLWANVLKEERQREALIDLHLTRLDMEYVQETVVEDGKKKKVTDEWGRSVFSKEPKYDKEGNPKWKIDPLDLEVFARNVSRYGLWLDDLFLLKDAMDAASEGKSLERS
jgi:hypothetical protein